MDKPGLFKQVLRIVRPLYLVGGSVRDLLSGREPADYDFSTPLSPGVVEQQVALAGYKPHISGKKFGTIGFRLGDQIIEITTFRNERYTKNSRKPIVTFIDDIVRDLQRRDFTMNAMALDEVGNLIDPFGGQKDLKAGRIRAVGNPKKRFREDPLRMLRAARFAGTLGFEIDMSTLQAIRSDASAILHVSKERWSQELDKLITGPCANRGLMYMLDTGLLSCVLPEVALQHLAGHTAVDFSFLDRLPTSLETRWAALLRPLAVPLTGNQPTAQLISAEFAQKIGTYLAWPKSRIVAVQQLISTPSER